MEHDLKSLQVFIEQQFEAVTARQTVQHVEGQAALRALTDQVRQTNGRVTKMEVAIAVLKFAVFTIGGALLAVALQLVVRKFGG